MTSVHIDATAAATVINDFGAGNFEIGATNATNLNAQSTSHLVMDLPGTLDYVGTPPFGPTPGGITVNGSLLGQNLLQGTAGLVVVDTHGHNIANNAASFGINGFGVYEAQTQSAGGGWGNDTLTGGAGWRSVGTSIVGGAVVTTFSVGLSNAVIDTQGVGPGNTGDNFFPEGGTDVVNIAATEQGKFSVTSDVVSSSGSVLVVGPGVQYENDSTVWVGFYDVCNSAGPWADFNAPFATELRHWRRVKPSHHGPDPDSWYWEWRDLRRRLRRQFNGGDHQRLPPRAPADPRVTIRRTRRHHCVRCGGLGDRHSRHFKPSSVW